MINWNTMRNIMLELQRKDINEFLKALISIEKGIEDDKLLDYITKEFFNREDLSLFDSELEDIIQESFEQIYEGEK